MVQPFPSVLALCRVENRLMVIAPDDHEVSARRTFTRMVVDVDNQQLTEIPLRGRRSRRKLMYRLLTYR
jgi:hypothetical protein